MCEFGFDWPPSCKDKKRTREHHGKVKYGMLMLLTITAMVFTQTVYDSPGPHTLWNGDSLQQADTLDSDPLHTGHFAYMGIWIKTTNPADSTKYRISFTGAFSMNDSFALPSDSLGAEADNTIMRISDTLWHYCSVQVPCATYTKIRIVANDTDHGDRACLWVKVFLWRPGYWEDFKPINE